MYSYNSTEATQMSCCYFGGNWVNDFVLRADISGSASLHGHDKTECLEQMYNMFFVVKHL